MDTNDRCIIMRGSKFFFSGRAGMAIQLQIRDGPTNFTFAKKPSFGKSRGGDVP